MFSIPDTPTPTRRMKIIELIPEAFVELCKNHEPITLSFDGVPKDARVVSGNYDIDRRTFCVVIESESFPEVKLGMMLERIYVTVTRHYYEAALHR